MAGDELNQANGADQRSVTFGQLVALLDGRAVTRSNIPKVSIFHFKGDKVSEWLELLEKITDEMTEEEKFRQISKYVWWEIRPEVMLVATEAAGNWGNFKAEMQRRYQLGDGLLTTEDLERLERSDFTTVGAFATAFEKMARKVPGLAEESQCAIFLSNFTECDSVSLTKRGAIGRKLTWETVKQSLADGELDQARVVTEGEGINLQQLIADGIAKYQADQQKVAGKQVLTLTQPQAKAAKKVVEQMGDDDDDEEEEPVKLIKSQRKVRNQFLGGQGSGKNTGVQVVAPAQVNVNQASTSAAPPQGPASVGPWPGTIPPVWPGYRPYGPLPFYNQVGPPVGGPTVHAAGGYPNAPTQGVNWQGGGQQQQQVPPPRVNQPGQAAGQGQGQNQRGNGQSNQGRGNGGRGRGNGNGGQGGKGSGSGVNWNGQGGNNRPRFDWRNAICHHCALKGHTFRFCQIRKVDEGNGLISTNMDGDIYNMHGKYIDPKIAGGMRKEALRRAELGRPPPAMFRLWQEEDVRSTIKVKELVNSESEEDIRREEPVVIEEEEEEESYCQGRVIDTMEQMEDLVEKMQRLNLKMRSICDEVAKPMVFLLGLETGPSSVKPACQTLGSTPGSGITFRPPRGQPTFPQAVCTRSKKGDTSSCQEPPSESQPREKKPVIDVGGEGKEDEEDEWLRKEEEEQAAQRAKKRKTEERPEKAVKGESSWKQKYAVPLEDGLDIEALADRLLQGHNDLLNLKEILASAPKLREGFKTRLSRRRVASVRLGDLIPVEAHWAVPGTKMDWKSVGTGSVNLSIKGPTALGDILIQAYVNGEERPLRFESRTLNGTERNYSQFKREILAVLHCLRVFRNYLFRRRFVLRVDPTALVSSLKNYAPSDPTIARWLTYVWMFDFEMERIPGNKNRADRLSRINWDKSGDKANEDIPPVDAFLDEEEDVKLHINAHAVRVSGVIVQGQSAFLAPAGYVKRADIVLKDFVEEDPWGGKEVEWMAKLALTEIFQLGEDPLVIESGAYSLDTHTKYVADVSFLVNSIVQVQEDGEGSRDPVRDMEEDEFEEGEIMEVFRTAKYEGVYRELGLLLSCEIREREATKKVLEMRPRFLIRDGYLFIKNEVGNPRWVICGRNHQIDVIVALHDGPAGGHRAFALTYATARELYYWEGMSEMICKYCESCIPCQIRASTMYKEPLYPRIVRDAGAVVHLDLLAMPQGVGDYNYIFDERDNLTGGRRLRREVGDYIPELRVRPRAQLERDEDDEGRLRQQQRESGQPEIPRRSRTGRRRERQNRGDDFEERDQVLTSDVGKVLSTYDLGVETLLIGSQSQDDSSIPESGTSPVPEMPPPPTEVGINGCDPRGAPDVDEGAQPMIGQDGEEATPRLVLTIASVRRTETNTMEGVVSNITSERPYRWRDTRDMALDLPQRELPLMIGPATILPMQEHEGPQPEWPRETTPMHDELGHDGQRVQSQSEPAVEDGERGAMGPSSLGGSSLLSESRLAEKPTEPESSLTAQLNDMESPRMVMRQEVSQPSPMDMETERVEAEVLWLGREGLTEDTQTQRVETSPLDFGDTPRRDGDQTEASMRGHIEVGAEHTQDASPTHEEESLPESRGPIDHEPVMGDAWLAEEMGRMPSLHFPGWLTFKRLGQVARPHLSVDQTTSGLRVLYDDLTLQRNYTGSGLVTARQAIEQVRDYTRRVVIRSFELSCERQMEHDALREVTQRLFYEDAAIAGWQEEVRMRRRTREEPMPEGERTQAEDGLQGRLLFDASVRELVGVMEHVRRLTKTEVARGEVLQGAVQRIGTLEPENRGLRDTVRDLVTSAERARQSTSRLEQRITDLEKCLRHQTTTDVSTRGGVRSSRFLLDRHMSLMR
ncbi:hypothetical protein CBR_g50728 [Chara braunii]|uniref:Reverse transcriptase RNase H-like domain-containing protein n=1 Tax=Chara braunii TaxID=69332 RepID=A0A388K5P2_CHABU|nr:hypothetical protein CBR_g50728 [Chara braunii]|eukprot:GBG65367.1 hypothetical protein CBR_g50728 [Chara braunii]